MVEFQNQIVKRSVKWVWHSMGRTKKLPTDLMETPLKRCLTSLDITLLGIGHMVGAGAYVLTGTVAKDTAGPAVVISFLIAGFVSILSALCYAEFGARVPKAGSAYVYAYVSIGEFCAFVIGWNIILEYMIGSASVSRAWSGYVDSFFEGAISNFTIRTFGEFHEDYLAPYPDPIAFLITMVCACFLSIGVKKSSYFNSILTLVNMAVITFVIVAGMFWGDLKNWQTEGGFSPFGVSGIIAGAATSFYAFVGFDSISISSEEALNPKRSIPLATFTSMGIVTAGYVLLGAVLTLMVPYYTLNPSAAIPDAFAANNLYWAKYIVSIGALCGMTTSLFGGMFSLPRCVYAMAKDGLMFSLFSKVSDKTQVPVLNIIFCGFLTAIIAFSFDIEKLVEFMSIGTLMAYTIVSASVIILRYRPVESYTTQDSVLRDESEGPPSPKSTSIPEETDSTEADNLREKVHPFFRRLAYLIPRESESQLITWAVTLFTVAVASLFSLIMWGSRFLEAPVAVWAVFVIIILLILIAVSIIVIAAHRQVECELAFKVPLVPYIPLLSIFCNIFLMVHLNPMTWVRFIIWMAIGLLLYFCYGIRHSKEGEPVSSYSTLLSDSNVNGGTVFGKVHEKLSEVTSKIISTANGAIAASTDSKTMTEKTSDKHPIIDKKGEDEDTEQQRDREEEK